MIVVTDSADIQSILQDIAEEDDAYGVIFSNFANRTNAMSVTTVDATYENIRRNSSGINTAEVTKDKVRNLFSRLDSLRDESGKYLIGQFVRQHGRNKARFIWENADCFNVGRAALGQEPLHLYKFEDDDESRQEVDYHNQVNDGLEQEIAKEIVATFKGANLIISVPPGFRGTKSWKRFLEMAKIWAEDELDDL